MREPNAFPLLLLFLEISLVPIRAALNAVAVSPDGRIAIAGGDKSNLYVWSISEDHVSRTIPADEHVFALSWSPDRRTIAAGTGHGCQLWRRSGTEYAKVGVLREDRTVLSTAIAPDGATIAFGVEGSGNLYFFDLATKTEIGELFERSNLTSGMAYSPGGDTLATAGNSFSRWNARPASLPRPPTGYKSPDDSADAAKPWCLWTATVPQTVEYAAAVAYSDEGAYLAGVNGTGGRGPRAGGRTLRIWDAKSGRTLRTAFSAGMGCLAFLRNGNLATGSDDGTLRVWDVGTGRTIHEWRGHKGEVRGLAALPGRGDLVSAGEDGLLCVWDSNTGKRIGSVICEGR